MLTRQATEYLLDSLCVELGFCLPPPEREALTSSPPATADAFTEAVFIAEGLDPRGDRRLHAQVHDFVVRAFRRARPDA